VPAVAVRRGRQVLFIFNRFKGYLNGIKSLEKRTNILELYVRRIEYEECRDEIL
jgi:hypothetical protein